MTNKQKKPSYVEQRKALPGRAEAVIASRGGRALMSYVLSDLLLTTGFGKKKVAEVLDAMVDTGRLDREGEFLVLPGNVGRVDQDGDFLTIPKETSRE